MADPYITTPPSTSKGKLWLVLIVLAIIVVAAVLFMMQRGTAVQTKVINEETTQVPTTNSQEATAPVEQDLSAHEEHQEWTPVWAADGTTVTGWQYTSHDNHDFTCTADKAGKVLTCTAPPDQHAWPAGVPQNLLDNPPPSPTPEADDTEDANY